MQEKFGFISQNYVDAPKICKYKRQNFIITKIIILIAYIRSL